MRKGISWLNSFIINEVDMKKLFLLTALFCICAACESIEIIVSPAPDSDEIVTKSDYKVSQAQASEFVRIYKKDQDYTVSPVVEGSDTLLFVYNFNQGWLVIAGDKRINPIVGENKEGNLNIAEAPEVILSWLEERAYNIMMLRSDQTAIDNEHTFLWKNLFSGKVKSEDVQTKAQTMKWCVVSYLSDILTSERDVIPHLIETKWGQSYPWNAKCPVDNRAFGLRCPTGCAAVAVAQMVYYCHNHYGKPDRLYHMIDCDDAINGKTSDIGFTRADLNLISPRWDDMALSRNSGGNTEYVCDLMLDIGNRLGMEYSGTSSGAFVTSDALSYYDLTFTQSDYSWTTVRSNLNNEMPVIVTAYNTKTSSAYTDGHAWIIDGIRRVTTTYRWQKHAEYSENWMHESEVYNSFDEIRNKYGIDDEFDIWYDDVVTDVDYLLMNWGYDGIYDDGTYSSNANLSWEDRNENGNTRPYIYKREIYYDFRQFFANKTSDSF